MLTGTTPFRDNKYNERDFKGNEKLSMAQQIVKGDYDFPKSLFGNVS